MSTVAATAASTAPPTLAERLGKIHVGLRADLEVTRHRFRGRPVYIVRDPLTFQSHRFEPADYRLLARLRADRPLAVIAAELEKSGDLASGESEKFYQFVFSLHRIGFLNLPIADDQALFRRHQAKTAARRKQKLLGFLFLQVPLVNPDKFLARTLPAARWLFTRAAFGGWLLLMLAAVFVAYANRHDLYQPLNALLATQNLVIMWFTLVGLKVLHEFGHAYACKRFGGHVPEMGAFFIVFTPCAYVDATACWGFTSKLQRLIVCLAGMYVESICAALALFIWAATEPGWVHSIAYNAMFLASLVTVLFNANPLMRYDGYYVLSDWVEVPNLRAHATRQVQHWCKRALLGVRDATPPARGRLLATLLTFGFAAAAYRVLILVGIVALLAAKLKTVGFLVGTLFVLTGVTGLARKLLGYLWRAEETAPRRGRAIALSAVLIVGIPLAWLALPVRSGVVIEGVVQREVETVIRATTPGFLDAAAVKPGARVSAGAALAQLTHPEVVEAAEFAAARLVHARRRLDAYRATDAVEARAEEVRLETYEREAAQAAEQAAALAFTAPHGGEVVEILRAEALGQFLEAGAPLARLVDGRWQVRALLSAEQFAHAAPAPGAAVAFRSQQHADRTHEGVIRTVRPAGTRRVELRQLTHLGGGTIVVNELGDAVQPYFEIVAELHAAAEADVYLHDARGQLYLTAETETLGRYLLRRVLRFTDRLLQT